MLPHLNCADMQLPANAIKVPHQLGMCVTINHRISDRTLANLLRHGVRILHIQLAHVPAGEQEKLCLKVTTALANHFMRQPGAPPIGRAIEIRGRVSLTGRLRNDQKVRLNRSMRIVLTANEEYAQSSSDKVLYLSNFDGYLKTLQLGDFIFINRHRIQLVVVKITAAVRSVTCCICRGSELRSLMDVTLPYLLPTGIAPNDMELDDCRLATECGADYIVVPAVTDVDYMSCVSEAIRSVRSRRGGHLPLLLANIECSAFPNNDHASIDRIIQQANGIWINRYEDEEFEESERYCVERSRQMAKPIVAAAYTDSHKVTKRSKTITQATNIFL